MILKYEPHTAPKRWLLRAEEVPELEYYEHEEGAVVFLDMIDRYLQVEKFRPILTEPRRLTAPSVLHADGPCRVTIGPRHGFYTTFVTTEAGSAFINELVGTYKLVPMHISRYKLKYKGLIFTVDAIDHEGSEFWDPTQKWIIAEGDSSTTNAEMKRVFGDGLDVTNHGGYALISLWNQT